MLVELIIYNCAIFPVYHGAEMFARIGQKILLIRNYKLAILSVCDVNAYDFFFFCVLCICGSTLCLREYITCLYIGFVWKFVTVCGFCEQLNCYSISRKGSQEFKVSVRNQFTVTFVPAHSLLRVSCSQPTASPNQLYQVLPVSKSIVIPFLELIEFIPLCENH